ncbi:hypothetical protein [Pseudoruegeria sp. HB172150]|uniref:hypothetical protein n=1 Tax=Pseudoruegeria sp. HB172150 TaxID=2721164 RepID=UPI001551ED24|nr:hypothetical protein [Pseudoruegeria sp. HB172150]
MSALGFAERHALPGLPVFSAQDFRVCSGVSLGDPLGPADELLPDDVYRLSASARRMRLSLDGVDGAAHFTVANRSRDGRWGAVVHLDCCATFMSVNGTPVDLLILVELEPGTHLIAATYLLPLAQLQPRAEYTLIAINAAGDSGHFAGLARLSFRNGVPAEADDVHPERVEQLDALTAPAPARAMRRMSGGKHRRA